MIREFDPRAIAHHRADLTALLVDAVDSGASVGFLPPLSHADADAYWAGVANDVADGATVMLTASIDERVVGSVQLALALRPNGRHRAEVQRLLVHRDVRRQGLGRRLMESIEDAARRLDRSLIVLDTRRGDASESLYTSLGYTEAGSIPGYARSADGSLAATVFFYKELALT